MQKVDTEYLRLSRVDLRTLLVLYSYQNCVYLIKFVMVSVGVCVTIIVWSIERLENTSRWETTTK